MPGGPPRVGVALLVMVVRGRPTLPQPLGCSTIGAERLNFRVRDGTGCFPFAMAAVTLADRPPPGPWLVGAGVAGCGHRRVCPSHCSVVTEPLSQGLLCQA